MLIAEHLLLLACTPAPKPQGPHWPPVTLLAAAVVGELAVMGRLRYLAGLVIAPDSFPTSSTVLTDALAVLERRQEMSVQHAVDTIATAHRDLRQELLDSMVRRGVLESWQERQLLILQRRCYRPSAQTAPTVLDPLRRYAVSGDLGDHRGAALFALADLAGLLERLLDSGTRSLGREMLQRLEAECTGTRAATDPMNERARLVLALTQPSR